MKKQNGSVLIITLILLMAASALMISILNDTSIQTKMVHRYYERQQTYQAAQASLTAAEKTLINNSAEPCIYPEEHANFYPQQPQSWWQGANHCEIGYETVNSRYIIERIGTFACVLVVNPEQENKAAAYYYRITARAQQDPGLIVMLQSTLVVAQENNQECTDDIERRVYTGRQSWRHIL